MAGRSAHPVHRHYQQVHRWHFGARMHLRGFVHLRFLNRTYLSNGTTVTPCTSCASIHHKRSFVQALILVLLHTIHCEADGRSQPVAVFGPQRAVSIWNFAACCIDGFRTPTVWCFEALTHTSSLCLLDNGGMLVWGMVIDSILATVTDCCTKPTALGKKEFAAGCMVPKQFEQGPDFLSCV